MPDLRAALRARAQTFADGAIHVINSVSIEDGVLESRSEGVKRRISHRAV
jgi:hypothetical protein